MFIILLVQFGLLSGHLLGYSCPLGKQFVFIVFCLFVIFIFISRFGFKSGICLLIAPVPVHCFSITFKHTAKDICILDEANANIDATTKSSDSFLYKAF